MLDKDQTDFIQGKVRRLGSVEAVEDFYRGKNGKLSQVDAFARRYAKKLFRKDR